MHPGESSSLFWHSCWVVAREAFAAMLLLLLLAAMLPERSRPLRSEAAFVWTGWYLVLLLLVLTLNSLFGR